MGYIDAIKDNAKDKIYVVERNKDGVRVYNEYPADYSFYYDDKKGKYQTIYRTPVSKFSTNSSKEFRKELKIHSNKKIWEGDCNVIFRCLAANYIGQESPKLHTCFLDIETDWSHGEAAEDLVVLIRKK